MAHKKRSQEEEVKYKSSPNLYQCIKIIAHEIPLAFVFPWAGSDKSVGLLMVDRPLALCLCLTWFQYSPNRVTETTTGHRVCHL